MTPWTIPSRFLCLWDFSRQEHCSGLSFPFPKDLPDTGIKPGSPVLQADSLPLSHLGNPSNHQFRAVQFSCSVMYDSLWPHELQHARPPCPTPTPGVHSDSHPSSQWCHPAISSSVAPFFSCPQSLPALKSFPMSQHFVWGGQSTGVSASASCLPKKSQGWSPLGWTG